MKLASAKLQLELLGDHDRGRMGTDAARPAGLGRPERRPAGQRQVSRLIVCASE